jgi:transposase
MTLAVAIRRQELTAEQLRRAASTTSDANQARRLLAIALVLEGSSRGAAARSCGMDRQTLRDWVHRYNDEGVAGLVDRSSCGPEPRLSPAQVAEVAALLENGPDLEEHGVVRWRRSDLQALIARRYGVHLHERSVGKLLHRLGFRRLSVRPRHPQAELDAQETFKKTSPRW